MKKLKDVKTLRTELREFLNSDKTLNSLKEGTPENLKYKALSKEIDDTREAIKQNDMFLFIEAQNLVNNHINKTAPEMQKRIKNIFGEKFLNMDNSRNHKHKDLFNDIEGTEEGKRAKFNYRLTTHTRTSGSNFILDVSVDVWNVNGSQNFNNIKYLAEFENGTSFKSLYDHEELPTYKLTQELKKLKKYQAAKQNLNQLKEGLNISFASHFNSSFNRDHY